MYRLLKLRRFSLCNAQSVISQIAAEAQFQTCSHCNQALFRGPSSRQIIQENSTRFHATESSSAAVLNIPLKRKKTKKPRKKYTELLEVSEGSSVETKAKVSSLKPKEFSLLLADSLAAPIGPGGEILGDGGHCGGVVGLDSELAEFDRQLEEEEATRLTENEMDEETVTTSPQTLSKKGKTSKQLTESQAQQMELDLAGRSESLTRSIIAYLDLCVSCGFLHRGLSTLIAYQSRTNRDAAKISSVGPYNILICGFAAKGNLGKVCELLTLLTESEVSPNVSTFNACFECVGRLPNEPITRQKLQEWERMMEKQGITLNQLFQEGVFVGDQREKVLNACERLRGPEFQPTIVPPPVDYSCTLLQDLNRNFHKKVVQNRVQGLLSAEQLSRLAAEQLEMEQRGSISVKSVEHQTQPTETTLFYRKRLEEAQANWRTVVMEAFQRDLQCLRVQHQNYRGYRQMTLYPFFKVLPPEHYVEIVMEEIRRLAEGSETFSPSLQLLYRDVGAKVLSRYQIQSKLQGGVVRKIERLYEEYCEWFASNSTQHANTRSKWQQLMLANSEGPTVTAQNKTWSNPIQINVGKFLYNIILRDIKVDVNMLRTSSKKSHSLPAFYSLYRSQGKLVKEEVKPHPLLARLFRGAAPEQLVFNAQSVPMLCPPVPWSSVFHGGHIIANTEIIRLPYQAVQQWDRMVNVPPSQLYPALDSLNQLGSVPWRINEPMLDVVTEVFRSGGSSELDIPEPPSACPPPDQVTLEMTKSERFQAYRRRLALRRKKAEMYSLWCDALYRLSLASHFRKHIFWLPHNMDFRGRVYPCPPHLNHMGSDMARSILCFAKGEPLGQHGLDWLKIHIVNLTGLKKRESVAERLRFAEEIMPEILDSADNPLTGRRWWSQSDEPWQTLACCMEVARASRSPNPAAYVSHFPIHQDGSCNGLQHYAALGRDEAGAISVNLTPAPEPQDVYSCVAALVERERTKDAAAGVKVAQVLDGYVKRKVIKQTVMTTVYGVTRYGARLQIARQLKDIDKFPKDFVWQSSTYLVGKTFESLREMFTSTKEIQDWFTESARLISQVRGQNVEWVTPLGLPIVQPYSRNKKADSAQGGRKLHEHYNMDMFDRPNVMKQKNAFPPNFIHSLDSSHMMLTSLFCEQQGITFVSVHDCFWTHPSTVHIMNKVCREQFVALHKQPILEDLSRYLVERYSFDSLDLQEKSSLENAKKKLNLVLTQVPPRGRFDLSKVLKSIYFFS